MLVTLSGRVMLVMLERFLKAEFPIFVTDSPSGEMAGTTISVSVQVPIPDT